MATTTSLSIAAIAMGVCGGLALFLFGMGQMTDALKLLAGERMKRQLGRWTANRFKAAFTGAFVTSVIQSSSITTVLLVGFISAGLMTLQQSIGVIMGANIGTTVTAQIIAFKVSQYGLWLVASGFALLFIFKSKRVQQYGHMIMGLGLILFGMEMMAAATHPLRTDPRFLELMQRMDDPLLGILVGAAFTAVVQSSSATTGVIIVLAGQGFIHLEAGIALALGANVGTCVTALLSSLGKSREAVQAAVAHVVFNVLGVVIWFGFVDKLADLSRWISPSAPQMQGAARLAAETPRQVANAHTIFNVANTLIFIGFTGTIAAMVQRIVPAARVVPIDLIKPKYLDPVLLQTPDLALDRARLELERLGHRVLTMVGSALPAVLDGPAMRLEELIESDNEVDQLHGAIIGYLGRLSMENLDERQTAQIYATIGAANYIENIGDIIEHNFVVTGRARLDRGVTISPGTRKVVIALHAKVIWAVETAIRALGNSDREAAESVLSAKESINQLAAAADGHLARRLIAEAPHRLAAFRLESDLIENLKRVYYLAKRIAKVVAESEGEPVTEGELPAGP